MTQYIARSGACHSLRTVTSELLGIDLLHVICCLRRDNEHRIESNSQGFVGHSCSYSVVATFRDDML